MPTWSEAIAAEFANRCADLNDDVPLAAVYLRVLQGLLEERCQPKGRKPVAASGQNIICDDGTVWFLTIGGFEHVGTVPGSPADTE